MTSEKIVELIFADPSKHGYEESIKEMLTLYLDKSPIAKKDWSDWFSGKETA